MLNMGKITRSGCERSIVRSSSNPSNQKNSLTRDAVDLYFDSTIDLEIVCCFLDFQDMRDSPKKKTKTFTLSSIII